jgi:soluble lytic murein transglycosylase-like protein
LYYNRENDQEVDMSAVQKALFPGILASSLLLILLNYLVQPRATASATNMETASKARSGQSQNKCLLAGQYPAKVEQWCSLIEEQAVQHELDPLLIAAVMLVESGGQPEVISHSGAVGLMQVMPRDGIAATFQCINGPCFASRPTISELKDPKFNVEYGVRMLAGLVQRYGNTRDALKAYGPADVDYWYADKVLGIYAMISADAIP